jgi:hypothetical protein
MLKRKAKAAKKKHGKKAVRKHVAKKRKPAKRARVHKARKAVRK